MRCPGTDYTADTRIQSAVPTQPNAKFAFYTELTIPAGWAPWQPRDTRTTAAVSTSQIF